MRYWLINSGTTEDPFTGDLPRRYATWAAEEGEVHMFPWRPRTLQQGDVLIHRAVGVAGSPLVALGVATSDPRPGTHARWPWLIERRLEIVVARLEDAPTLSLIGLQRGPRVMMELAPSTARRAEEHLRTAGAPYLLGR